MSLLTVGLSASLLLSAAGAASPQEEAIAGHPYAALATREATEARMRELLQPGRVEWGSWHLLSAFPFAGPGRGDLARVHAPEPALLALGPEDDGPDLGRTYAGKGETTAHWRELGDVLDRRVDLHVHEDQRLNDMATCYLWTTIESEHDLDLPITCGSDDGLRLWLNGQLLVDADVPRGLNPLDHALELPLRAGRNHLVAKVGDGQVSWDFQLNGRRALTSEEDALLQWFLDRDFPPSPEREFYRVTTLPAPKDVLLEVGGLDFLPDGSPLVATRRGEVWRVGNADAEPPRGLTFERFASGLHEPLGLSVRVEADGTVAAYTMQRSELTRLVDEDGDGEADLYECYANDWGVSGNYHEFAFGPEFDAEGNAWVSLNVGFCGALGKSVVPYRGWVLKVAPDREVIPVSGGMRSPNGLGAWVDGAMFYVDNQGDYVGTNRLSWVEPGSWQGHPSSLRWNEAWADDPPERQPASVWFPYRKMGQSAADVELDDTGGRFGPFEGQLFVGDQTLATVMRVSLERIGDHYQGACYPFLGGLDSGVNRVRFAPDGSMYVGETDRGWGSIGRRNQGLQRVVWTGEVPFEVRAMRARHDGFELEFTLPVDRASATDPGSYTLESYTYRYHADYGSPEVRTRELAISSAEQVDPHTVRLGVEGLREGGFVHELRAAGVRSRDAGEPLLHDVAYYTLEVLPPASATREAAVPARIPAARSSGAGGRSGEGAVEVDVQAPGEAPGEAPATAGGGERALPRVLFLTHSAGFEHSVVRRPGDGTLAHAERILGELCAGRYEVEATKDCARIAADGLADLAAVVFYTTGDLPIPGNGRRELLDWVARGGAFVGIHPASDTFHGWEPYLTFVGGEFANHPWHEEVGIRVDDPTHPTTRHLGTGFRIVDEIYQFLRWEDEPPLRVVLSLDPAGTDMTKSGRPDRRHGVAWAREWGEGRVFYTALGHREDVWTDPRFQQHLAAALDWTVAGPDLPVRPPSNARVLLGSDAEPRGWHHVGGSGASWDVVPDGDGGRALEVRPGAGDLRTRELFGGGWVHVEFQVPLEPEHAGQARGNSGVYLAGSYEVQVLDSYGREPGTGDAGALYGVAPPAVNAAREPGRWQTFDVHFTPPRYDGGAKVAPARASVWWNGIRVHDEVELPGATTSGRPEAAFGEGLGPLLLQDHGSRVRYRNVWIVPDAI